MGAKYDTKSYLDSWKKKNWRGKKICGWRSISADYAREAAGEVDIGTNEYRYE